MHRWKVGLAPAEPAYRKRRRRALVAERKSRRRERERSITAGLSRSALAAPYGRPSAEHRDSTDRDPAVVARIMGDDLGRSSVGFEGTGLIQGGFFFGSCSTRGSGGGNSVRRDGRYRGRRGSPRGSGLKAPARCPIPGGRCGSAGFRNIRAARCPARQPGDGKLKPLEDAPGSYVKVRAED